jgi:hypothetical protein
MENYTAVKTPRSVCLSAPGNSVTGSPNAEHHVSLALHAQVK